MKLEHGKKYVTYHGDIVGPLIQLHDGRFSYGDCVWDESGAILTRNFTIASEYSEPDPNETTPEYKHEQVGVTMTLPAVKLEEGKIYITGGNKRVGPLTKLSDNKFVWHASVWDMNGIYLLSRNGPVGYDDILEEYTGPRPTNTSPAATFLDKVKEVVAGPREKEYGDKTENHARIAKLWNMWLTETKEDGDAITPYDVATMMLMVKLARLMQSPGHKDSHIDIAGYVACMEEIYDRQ